MSESVQDPDAGLNGGFEVARDGLPVNWIIYSPKTVPTGDFRLLLDKKIRHEGEQSLCFAVEECSSIGGWKSPGFTRQFPAKLGASYRIGFWVRNDACTWTFSYGGVKYPEGSYQKVEGTTVDEGDWQYVERVYAMPAEFDQLRIELSITAPGSLWIDDVTIEEILDEDEGDE